MRVLPDGGRGLLSRLRAGMGMSDPVRCKVCGGLMSGDREGKPCFMCTEYRYPRAYPAGVLRIVREGKERRESREQGTGQTAIEEGGE